ncbi:MAG: Smr/MutS family protein [Deltaproteobacteria bacterium]|nr:Smr/MutS family protein [Deltaproteobacteria bacterium]MBW2396861.1 Smr/MutS family protein [Deltaproteobacteria bacterium]
MRSTDPDDPPFDDEIVHVPITEALDLHDFAPREIPEVVEAYLEAAWEKGFREVRLIHGRGKGVQRARIQSLLAKVAHAHSWGDAPAERGGWGATLVQLQDPENPQA